MTKPMPKCQSLVRTYSSLFAGLLLPIILGVSNFAPRGLAFAPPVNPAPPDPADIAFFEKRVRPVLVENCISCHGPELQLGKVRLDTAEGVRATIVPGDPANSRLLKAMHFNGPVKMPPSGKRPDTEIAALTDWIKRGAAYPVSGGKDTKPEKWDAKSNKLHWSFRPVTMPRVPEATGAATPIDAFLQAKRLENQLVPAPRADKRTLLRRASFDLIGLPPTPAEVDAFLADKSPDAFAKQIDRLLASPHFGERWARHWLDVARYADSNGLDENIAFGNAYRYRDWVIGAMNADKPYNTFIQEQIAGDLMDSGSDEQLRNDRLTATGFLSLGAKVLAEPDKDKMVMDIVDEQIDVTSKSILGLTVSCARCHDHKFDPISTKDYYALAGIFKSTRTMATLNTVARVNQRSLQTAVLTAAIADHASKMQTAEKAVTDARTAATTALQTDLRQGAEKYARAGWELARHPGALVSVADTTAQSGDPARQFIEGVSYARGNANRDSATFGTKETPLLHTVQTPTTAEWDVSVPKAGRYLLEVRYTALEARPMHLVINDVVITKEAVGSITGGWKPDTLRWEPQAIIDLTAGNNRIRLERNDAIPHLNRLMLVPVSADAATNGTWATTQQAAEDIGKRDHLLPAAILRYASRAYFAPTPEDAKRRATEDTTLLGNLEKSEAFFSGPTGDAYKKAVADQEALSKNAPAYPIAIAVEESKPEDVRIHIRGNTQTLGDIAPRGFPVVLAKYSTAPVPAKASGRKELALWLTRPENPLTARVEVNRIWQHLFGAGLVRTPDNWGLRGEKPTHPELLDYLAATFVKEGWSQKKLIRRVMLTDAYQMTSVAPNATVFFHKDPENRFLWRANRRRLEAEPLRDSLLFVAGELDGKMGGSLMTGMDGDYVTNDQSKDLGLYSAKRRSIYLPVIRNSLFDLFQSFDFGDGTTVNAWRADTTVAPQALYALNSPLVRDTAADFASSLPKATDATRIQNVYRRAYGRWATATEVKEIDAYIDRYVAASAAIEPDPAKRRQRAWSSFCQAILASNEFMYVN